MKNYKYFLSIVIPVYNEADSAPKLIDKITALCRQKHYNYEIIFIDDGSSDYTAEAVLEKRAKDGRVKLIRFRRNFGKSAALAAGFKHAEGEVIVTMDGDLQDDPDEIPRLIDRLEAGYDLVSGWKKDRSDLMIKRVSSKIFNRLVSRLFNLKLNDYNCGFKAYRQEAAQSLEIYGDLHRFLPILAHQQGFKVGEIPVRHHSRRYGVSKFGRLGLRRYKNFLFDPLSLLLITRYLERPAHLFGNISLLFFLGGGFICSYLSLLWFKGEPIGQRPLLFLGILLIIISVQLFSLGFLAEIIVNQGQKKTKKYAIKDKYL